MGCRGYWAWERDSFIGFYRGEELSFEGDRAGVERQLSGFLGERKLCDKRLLYL